MKKPVNTQSAGGRLRHLAIAAALGTAAFFGARTDARADLIGHWVAGAPNLIETSGVHPAGTHDGVAVGGNAGAPAFSTEVPPGYTGESLDLTAGNVGVAIANSASGDGGYVNTFDESIRSQCTIAFWAKGMPGQWSPWVCKRGEGSNGWQLRRLDNTSFACFTMRGIDNADGGGSTINVNNSPAKWHHFAGVWNQAAGTRTLYVDGVLSHVVSNDPTQMMNLAASSKLTLGCRANDAGDGFENYFGGLLYDVRLYNRPLTQSEVLNIIPPPVPTGLTATTGSSKIALLWTPSLGATSYTVSSFNTVTTQVETDIVAAPPYMKEGLDNGTLYNFKVLASNNAGSSAYTAEVSATPALGSAKDILTFSIGSLGLVTIVGRDIIKDVPLATDVTALTATYTISPYAIADASHPSGATINFTTPQTYTITAEDGSLKTYTVTVNKTDPISYDFNSGLQGWTSIWPAPSAAGLWDNGHLGPWDADNVPTRFGRSPEFYLNNLGAMTFQLAGGASRLDAPAAPSAIPETSIDGGGFAGVALRDVTTNTYLLAKAHVNGSGSFQEYGFSAADLAAFAHNNHKYTLDYIDYNAGYWGWFCMDNVSIPGTLAPADPFAAWIFTNYPTLSDPSRTGDPDGDGLSNETEFAFGLDPSSASSVNPITMPLNPATSRFQYTRRATSGLTYSVLTSTDLRDWTKDTGASEIEVTTSGDVQTVTVAVSTTAVHGKLFVRVQAQ